MPHSLKKMLSPAAIAIIGATEDFNRLNGRPLKFLLEKGFEGRIYPVNPKYETVAGLSCYPDIGAVPGPVDLAVVALPARLVPGTIEELGRAGVPAAVVFSSGFAETGEEGRVLERRLREAARAGGVRVCGPNTLGLINAFDKVFATFTQYAYGETPAGPAGFVTQSGAFGTAISALARQRGTGFGYFVNTGNECDVQFAEAMREVLADSRIRVGAGYIEGVADGEGLVATAEAALELGKPIVLTKVGRSDAGARAAASHTGSLAGEDAVFDGVVRQFGLLRARNEEHMLDLVETFAHAPLPNGCGVGIITQSGGAGVLMADRAEELGLEVPVLGAETEARLRKVLPPFGAAQNPVDLTAQFIAEPAILRESVKIMLEDPAIDIAVIWFQLMTQFVDELVGIFRELKRTVRKPMVAVWVAGPEDGIRALRKLGMPVLRGAEPAIDAVAGLVRYARARAAWPETAAARRAIVLPSPSALGLPAGGGIVASIDAARALDTTGVAVVRARLAESVDAAVEAAEELGYPLAMKIESPDIPHKTEAGGVKLGLRNAEEVRTAFDEIIAHARAVRPQARIHGILMQEMASGTVELVVGLKRDPVFGPVVMAGLGGVFVEVLGDVVFRRAPVTENEALAMLAELRGAALLDGVRGAPPVDKAAVARLIAAASRFGAAAGDRLGELDLNPVLAGPDGAVAVDWLMVLEEAKG